MVAATDKEKKRLAEKHSKILAELVKQPENSTCADCGAPGTRWASWNLGVFLCIRCGGFHRHLGTHITKVKSISLDNWTTEQLEHFRRIGNKRANAFFNPHPELHPPPRSDRDIERYIRDKYERRLFVDHRNGVADPTDKNAAATMAGADDYADEASALTKLREMGFLDVRNNHAALKMFGFNVDKAARHLRGEPTENQSAGQILPSDPRVGQLLAMGFDHAMQNTRALNMCNGDVNQAIELLLSDNPPSKASGDAPKLPAKPTPALPPKSTSSTTAVKSPAADLLDADIFGSVQPTSAAASASAATPAAAAANTSGGLNDLLGGLSLAATSSTPTASAANTAKLNTQNSNDLFGDFGDFISSPPASAANFTAANPPKTTASPAAVATTAATAPAAQSRNNGQGGFDTSFIMSLYSNQSQQQQTGNSSNGTGASPGNTQKGANKNGGSAFDNLDIFL
ncbi:Protein gts1 [Coemansia guatemalensis]|uniref:Protein gts1 n=1 Tax=Coemansia guatemalensis TaxID=2761395 RepID=A0A9W8I239_9FUNG|nr:Protein gts1 [Coemansia guatemalensis]